jgi:hypothetical protein
MSVRFSLRSLLLAIAYTSVAMWALVAGTLNSAAVIFSLTLVLMLMATINAIFRADGSRAFWTGFVIVGWAYMTFSFGPWFEGHVSQRLITTTSLYPLQRVVAPIHAQRFARLGFTIEKIDEGAYRTGPKSRFKVWGGSWQVTQEIGHSVWALILGLAGGMWAQHTAVRRHVAIGDNSPA